MNLAYFLIPKGQTAYLYDTYTFRQGLEKMRYHGYTAIPVITQSGQYIGTVTEGDFLWSLLDRKGETPLSMRELEHLQIRDIIRAEKYSPVHITIGIEELVNSAMNQNFIPVVDDLNNFVGIVTRKDVIRHLSMSAAASSQES